MRELDRAIGVTAVSRAYEAEPVGAPGSPRFLNAAVAGFVFYLLYKLLERDNVNMLVNAVVLNYLALHNQVGEFANLYASLGISHGLGSDLDRYVAFQGIVDGTVPSA